MAKKYIHKNSKKNHKHQKYSKHKLKKTLRLKNIYFKQLNSVSPTQTKQKEYEESPETTKILLDAQAAVKIQCYVCNRNISQQIKIILFPPPQKTKIHQKGFSFNCLCVRCFLLKSKFSPRDNSYYIGNEFTLTNYKFTEYRILKKFTEPLFTKDWSFGDEIKLLGAVEKLGLNNWEEISKALGKGKLECESHYYTFYYKDKDDYLPCIDNIYDDNKKLLDKNKQNENLLLNNLLNNIGYIPYSDNNKGSNRSLVKKDSQQDKNQLIFQNAYELLGYWFKRKEFDVEYKNEAEIELSELEFKEEDDEEEENMHYKILKNYNNVLDEREQRKKLISDKNLYEKRQINFDKKLSHEDKEIYQSMKMNIRFLNREQFFYIFDNNLMEKNMKARLNQLIYYKNLGFETFDEIQQYINNVKKENAKNEEEEKMKLRNSTINANKEYDEKLVAMEEEKLRKELGMKKKKFSQVKNYIFLEIKNGKKRNEVITQEIKDKFQINKKNAAKFVEIVNRVFQ